MCTQHRMQRGHYLRMYVQPVLLCNATSWGTWLVEHPSSSIYRGLLEAHGSTDVSTKGVVALFG